MKRFLLTCFCLICGNALADTTIIFTNVNDGNLESSRMEISDGRINFVAAGSGENARMIFDEALDQFTVVNDAEKTYMVFDSQMVERVAQMQQQVMAQMESQLAALPASQRERMRDMMKNMAGGAMGAAQPEERRVEQGSTDSVAGYDCQTVTIYSGDRRISEQCLVKASQLDIASADYQTLKAMQQFMLDLAAQFANVSDSVVPFGDPENEEIPVRYTHYSRQVGESRGQLDSISTDAINPDSMVVPATYTEQKIPEIGRR